MNYEKLTEANKQEIADSFGVPRFMLGMSDEYRKKLLALDRRGRDYIYGAVVIIPDRRA